MQTEAPTKHQALTKQATTPSTKQAMTTTTKQATTKQVPTATTKHQATTTLIKQAPTKQQALTKQAAASTSTSPWEMLQELQQDPNFVESFVDFLLKYTETAAPQPNRTKVLTATTSTEGLMTNTEEATRGTKKTTRTSGTSGTEATTRMSYVTICTEQ